MSKPEKKKFELLAEIKDLKSAQSAARQGTAVCVLIIVVTTVVMLIAQSSPEQSALPALNPIITAIEMMIYAVLAVMIYRMSRVASIAAFVLYLLDRIAMFTGQIGQGGSISMTNWFVPLLIILAFTNSIRGTFAYHRFRKERQEEVRSPEMADQSKS